MNRRSIRPVAGVPALPFTVFYVGAGIDQAGRLLKLPVGLVNAGKGATVIGIMGMDAAHLPLCD